MFGKSQKSATSRGDVAVKLESASASHACRAIQDEGEDGPRRVLHDPKHLVQLQDLSFKGIRRSPKGDGVFFMVLPAA